MQEDFSFLNKIGAEPGNLIKGLQAIQSAYGYVSDDAIRAAAKYFGRPEADVEGVISFYVGMGIVDNEGNIIKKEVIDYTNEVVQIEDIFDPINAFINENTNYDIESIGIGIPGISTDTLINYTCNLPLRDIEIRDYVKTHLPIYVSNDANCAAIAEYQIADGKLFSNYALVTFGTGIGAGIIINGTLYNGTTGAAGEIGHMVIEKEGIPCKCGRRGCFEKYASVSALKRMTKLDDIKEVFYLSERNEVIQRVLDNYPR